MEKYQASLGDDIPFMGERLSAYRVSIKGQETIVLALNINDASEKVESIIELGDQYEFLRHCSIPIVY